MIVKKKRKIKPTKPKIILGEEMEQELNVCYILIIL